MKKSEFDERLREIKQPINFDELVKSGALIQKGQSYYIGNKNLIPRIVSDKIKSIAQNRNGVKVTFYK
ncbi:hypothetical protein [Pseudoalteromonas sp.]|uniref:hypothetical protein n=1 Tax=Pseudoalteromonas sp. TaxID=53249 RepID=UPI002355DA5F|nr:hypothetical protein [Pseudoalteromonas sp.]